MILGLGTGITSIVILTSSAGAGVSDNLGEFLATDGGVFFATDSGQFILTNVQLKTLQTGTSLDLLTSSGDTMISYYADGNTTSATDPE